MATEHSALHTDVLIIGSGFAGSSAADTLSRIAPQLSVTIVDASDHFFYLPAGLRLLVQPEQLSSATHAHPFQNFLQGELHSLSENAARFSKPRLEDTAENADGNAEFIVHFKYCICAFGVQYPVAPHTSTLAQRDNLLREASSQIRSAKSIAIVGGGLVGVELAGELVPADAKSNTPTPSITMYCGKRGLLPRLPLRARKHAEQYLRARGVNIVKSYAIRDQSSASGWIERSSEAEIVADIVYDCAGGIAQSVRGIEWPVDRSGRLIVSSTLQHEDSSKSHIFAAGDCSSAREESAFAEKIAFAAIEGGRVAAWNVQCLHTGKKDSMKKFPQDVFWNGVFPRVFEVSLGEFDGMMCVGPLVMTGSVATFAKNGTQFLALGSLKLNTPFQILFQAVEQITFAAAIALQKLFPMDDLQRSLRQV